VQLKILILPGDGVGGEVTAAAVEVLCAVAARFGHDLQLSEGLIGGDAIHKTGSPLPEETLNRAIAADATLLGAVGSPDFDGLPPEKRPEKGLLGIRKALGLYANLRPVKMWPSLVSCSPLKDDVVAGTDLLIVRELTGGLYYGEPRSLEPDRAVNTMSYTRAEIERIARKAFQLARGRRKKVTSVDKSNVIENSQLWRRIVTEVARDFPDVALDHLLVDNCAMQLVLNPGRFDVAVMENTFGDILSDEAAVLAGSIGMLPSASLGEAKGLYEPVHGSAPHLAGKNQANPFGAIASAAAMLDYSFGLTNESRAIEAAIGRVLESGRLTPDLKPAVAAGTSEVARMVCEAVAEGQHSGAGV